MEEPDKKEVAQEDAEKLGVSETGIKEVIFYHLFQLGVYIFSSVLPAQSRAPVNGTQAGESRLY